MSRPLFLSFTYTFTILLLTSTFDNNIIEIEAGAPNGIFKTTGHLKSLRNPGGKGDSRKFQGRSDNACKYPFEGFGVHMGAIGHLTKATPPLIEQLADTLYNDLHLRRYRTSYEPFFSPSEDVYDISCRTDIPFTCTWNLMHKALSKYSDATIMASIWSPPYYMKNAAEGLKIEYEQKYYHYIKNITQLIKSTFNQTIELVSIVNEPENFVVSWDHCNMGPHQICRMVETFNDPLVSACPENAWFSITNVYMDHNFMGVSCRKACKTILTHAYAVDFNVTSPNFLSAAYDMNEYKSRYEQPIWQTEVSSTFQDSFNNQMTEGLGLAKNIIQFLGTTCVTRYYFWIAFTFGSSGESLIWGDEAGQKLNFPKKYFIYRHFTLADRENPGANIQRCDEDVFPGLCLLFNNVQTQQITAVFINEKKNATLAANLKNCDVLCCTTNEHDHLCDYEIDGTIPASSVCSCKVTGTETTTKTTETTTETAETTTKTRETTTEPTETTTSSNAHSKLNLNLSGCLFSIVFLMIFQIKF